MAGSKRWFRYDADTGNPTTGFALLLDESNTEAINGTAANVPALASRPVIQAPKGIKPRRIYYQSADGLRTIVVIALNATIYNAIPGTFPTIPDPLTTGGTLNFVRKRAEEQRLPNFGSDTGLTDGDSPG
jgi:hypothetical protein